MSKFFSVLQLLLAVLAAALAVATLVNLVLISSRPETISVVNAIIGQGLLIVCLAAFARVLGRKRQASNLYSLREGEVYRAY